MDRLLAIQGWRLLHWKGIAVKREEFETIVCSHPDYPSLLSLTETLDLYGIEYAAVRIHQEDIAINGFPFLAHLAEKNGDYVMVTAWRDGEVEYVKGNGGRKREVMADFMKKWGGVVVYVAGEMHKSWFPLYVKRRMLILIVLLCLVGMYYWVGRQMLIPLLYEGYGILKVVGLVLSGMLLLHESGGREEWLGRICHLGRMSDCDKVLRSEASKIAGISLADVGCVYFSGGIFCLVWMAGYKEVGLVFQLMLYVSFLTFPYTLFSLWYQLVKVKKICPFCMGVVVCLWGECVLAIWGISPISGIGIKAGLGLIAFYGMMGAGVYGLKRLLYFRQKAYGLKVNYMRLKRDKAVIEVCQRQMPEMKSTDKDGDIVIHQGNPDRRVVIVLSPFCAPCARLHERLEKLLKQYICEFTVILRFTGTSDLEKEFMNRVALYLIGIYHSQGVAAFEKALGVWYRTKDKRFFEQEDCPEIALHTLASSVNWCQQNGIHSTPFVLYNERVLPGYYEVEDVVYWANS